MDTELEVKVAEIDQRSKSNTHRIDALEEKYDILNRLATSIEVIATKQESMLASLKVILQKISANIYWMPGTDVLRLHQSSVLNLR